MPLPAPGTVERWAPARLTIDPWIVLRLARYRRRAEVVPAIWEATAQMTARARVLAAPAALLRTVEVEAASPTGVRLRGGSVFSGAAVGRLLRGCPTAILFVLTLGPRLESQVSALGDRREPLDAFLLDTAGWAALEAAVRALRLDLATRARAAGLRLTHRLGPGYRDWPLPEQHTLLALFAAAPPLVHLSEHAVLTPFKSLTGIFGARPRILDHLAE
ncbi:MAG TPA: hypothetical protein VLD61_01360 [Methylomirabilota bacterium]|nr:hypothetical protein [Methylomirabilota bacterium]